MLSTVPLVHGLLWARPRDPFIHRTPPALDVLDESIRWSSTENDREKAVLSRDCSLLLSRCASATPPKRADDGILERVPRSQRSLLLQVPSRPGLAKALASAAW